MSVKNILILVLIVGLISTGYFFLNKKVDKPNYSNNTPTPQALKKEISQIPSTGISIVVSEQNGSAESGIVIISEVNGKVNVGLKLTGGVPGVPQPAHLHSGVCSDPGKVVYPLTNVVNGESETILKVDMATFNQSLPLILNVHKSEQESDIYASCGEVSSK